jgi:hypothetical protein
MNHISILNLNNQDTYIKATQPFNSIQIVNIASNIPLTGEGPKGLRFTLINSNVTLDFFAFQIPGGLLFNCFDVMKQFDTIGSNQLFNDLRISCEGIEFDATTEIHLHLDIE